MYPSLSFIPTMSEFFRLCGNFSDHDPFPRRNFSHHVGIFPTMSEFFPSCRNFSQFPSYMPGKIPSLLMEGLPFLSLLRESSGICKAISRKSAETFSFLYSVYLIYIKGGWLTYVHCTLYVDCYRLALLARAHTDFFARGGGFVYVTVAVSWQDVYCLGMETKMLFPCSSIFSSI
jgi:hypothetical protein